VKYPNKVTSATKRPPIVPEHSPDFVKKVTAEIIAVAVTTCRSRLSLMMVLT